MKGDNSVELFERQLKELIPFVVYLLEILVDQFFFTLGEKVSVLVSVGNVHQREQAILIEILSHVFLNLLLKFFYLQHCHNF